jgi:murein DD-endopeptidase MepM/ murein hydrolase activator NlpD
MFRIALKTAALVLVLLFAAPAPAAVGVKEPNRGRWTQGHHFALPAVFREDVPRYREMLAAFVEGVEDLFSAGEHQTSDDEPELTVLPIANGHLSSGFGYRRHPILHRRKMHKGLDFAAKRGTEVDAAGAGVVVKAGWGGSYGRLVVIDHGHGLTSRYAHLSRISVSAGDIVFAGAEIARVGSTGRATGPHLHFEVRQDGRAIDPEIALAEVLDGTVAAREGMLALRR